MLPPLPPDHEAQPTWAFRDPTGRLTYEFNRVYGPSHHVVEDLSYWSVTWSELDEGGDQRLSARWISYARARDLAGANLSFRRFASLPLMRDELPALLDPGKPAGAV